ncbi:MAG: riboflavin synthase [Actinobacteria bacterium]|nr:riboflavin synthase [Actinomycetota bacterium]
MFTGIVEYKGSVSEVDHQSNGSRLSVEIGPLDGVSVGDSISINGVCLTAVEVAGGVVGLDVVAETLARTNLGELDRGSTVNVERAMAASGRFDGNVVQGHVDGVGKVLSLSEEGDGRRVSIEVPDRLIRYVVEKGSVTIDGVSLTVADISGPVIELALIPHTLESTTLGLRKVGDTINLEVDILAKYVERLLSAK